MSLIYFYTLFLHSQPIQITYFKQPNQPINTIMKQRYVLINNNKQIDNCFAYDLTSAQIEFSMRGWVEGDVMSLSDYQNETQLNALESESTEY